MPTFEYKIVPAPSKGIKTKAGRGIETRFAAALSDVMNEMGAEGWEYQRSDTLPCESRSAMGKKSSQFLNMLVFRREAIAEATDETFTPALKEKIAATPVLRRITPPVPTEEVSAEQIADEAIEQMADADETPS